MPAPLVHLVHGPSAPRTLCGREAWRLQTTAWRLTIWPDAANVCRWCRKALAAYQRRTAHLVDGDNQRQALCGRWVADDTAPVVRWDATVDIDADNLCEGCRMMARAELLVAGERRGGR